MRELESPVATQSAGAKLARALLAVPGHDPWLVGLEGELGAGKTTFVAGLLRELGHDGAVRSPTYTFIESYALAGRAIHHCDLYRITDPQEIEHLGLRELVNANAWLLVEWPSRAAGGLGTFDLLVSLDYAPGDRGRRLHATAGTKRGAALLAVASSIAHYIPTVSS
jgi:tRNA threonylcarbamoyladenosine biosynthesis protein TsaE